MKYFKKTHKKDSNTIILAAGDECNTDEFWDVQELTLEQFIDFAVHLSIAGAMAQSDTRDHYNAAKKIASKYDLWQYMIVGHSVVLSTLELLDKVIDP